MKIFLYLCFSVSVFCSIFSLFLTISSSLAYHQRVLQEFRSLRRYQFDHCLILLHLHLLLVPYDLLLLLLHLHPLIKSFEYPYDAMKMIVQLYPTMATFASMNFSHYHHWWCV
uniref:L3155 protein n=1 Tax=Saccharomyces cerevisiae TaxID=4932 RepID=E9PAA4_YEASX|nr:L3155 [Saccharomyces cerevisiae]